MSGGRNGMKRSMPHAMVAHEAKLKEEKLNIAVIIAREDKPD